MDEKSSGRNSFMENHESGKEKGKAREREEARTGKQHLATTDRQDKAAGRHHSWKQRGKGGRRQINLRPASSQDFDEIQNYSNRVVFLSEGNIRLNGTIKDIMDKTKEYGSYSIVFKDKVDSIEGDRFQGFSIKSDIGQTNIKPQIKIEAVTFSFFL